MTHRTDWVIYNNRDAWLQPAGSNKACSRGAGRATAPRKAPGRTLPCLPQPPLAPASAAFPAGRSISPVLASAVTSTALCVCVSKSFSLRKTPVPRLRALCNPV